LRHVVNNVTLTGGITLADDASFVSVANTPTLNGTLAIGAHTLLMDIGGTEVDINGSITGSGILNKTGSGRMRLGGDNSGFSGTLNLSNGIMRVDVNGGSAFTGNLTMSDGTSIESSSTADRTFPAALTIKGDVTFGGSADGSIIFSDTVSLGSATRTVTVLQTASGEYTEFQGVVSDGGLTKAGAGELRLGGVNTYTDATTISEGTLALTGSGSLSSTLITIGSNATFDVSGRSSTYTLGAQTLSAPTTADSTGTIVADAEGLTLAAASSLVFPTFTDGTAPLAVSGGALTLNSATTITVTNSGSALTDGTYKIISVSNGGSVAFDGGAPSVTVGGNGVSGEKCVELTLSGGELYISVSSGVGIDTQPMAQQVCGGLTATFSVSAPGATNYQWQVSTDSGSNWSDVTQGTGGTTDTYTTETLSTNDSGRLYRVIVSGSCGGATPSSTAALTVLDDVAGGTITPASALVIEGNSTNLTLTGYSGSSLQWQSSSDGTNYSNIADATAATYNTGSMTNDTWYRVIVSAGACGTATSAVSAIEVRRLDVTWDGGGADDNTLTEANWDGDRYPAATSNSTMRFAGTTRTSPNFNFSSGGPFGRIIFTNTTANFTLGGDPITLYSLIENVVAFTQTVSSAVTLADDVEIDAASGDVVLSGVVSGSGDLTKTGSETLLLSNANTFSGDLTISNGTVRVTDAAGLGGTAGGTTVASGGALELSGGIAVGAEALTLSGTGVSGAGALRSVDGTNSLAGTIELAAVTALDVDGSNGQFSVSGVISSVGASQNLDKKGAGTLVLTGNNTFTSQLEIDGGVVSVGSINSTASAAQPLGSRTTSPGIRLGSTTYTGAARGTLRYTGVENATLTKTLRLSTDSEAAIAVTQSGTELVVSNVISIGSTSASLRKLGDGRLTLASNNTYQGVTFVDEGVLRVAHANGLGNAGASANQDTRVADGATLEVSGGVTVNEQITIIGSGVDDRGAFRNVANSNTLNGTGDIILGANASIGVDEGTVLTINKKVSGVSHDLTKTGTGLLYLNTRNTFDQLRVEQGVVAFSEWRTTATTAEGQPIGNSSATNAVILGSAGNSGTLRLLETNISNFARSKGIALDAGGSGVIDVYHAGETLRLDQPIIGGGALVKSGAGTLQLEAANTYAGGTTLNAGTLVVTNDSNFGALPPWETSDNLTLNDGTLTLSGDGLTVHANRGITLGSSNVTFNTAISASHTVTVAGAISGAGGLIKTSNGTLRVLGAATYSNDTEVVNGILRLASLSNQADVVVHRGAGLYATGHVAQIFATGTVSAVRGANVQGVLHATNLQVGAGAELDVLAVRGERAAPLMIDGDITMGQGATLTVRVTRAESANIFQDTPLIQYTGSSNGTWQFSVVYENFQSSLTNLFSVQHQQVTVGGETHNQFYLRGTAPSNEIGSVSVDGWMVTVTADTEPSVSYDLIYSDAEVYDPTNEWTLAYTQQAGGTSLAFTNDASTLEAGKIRFYRISPEGAWNSPDGRLVSEFIYMAKKMTLRQGTGATEYQNWVSFPGTPVEYTAESMFGLEQLPAGATLGAATKVNWYDSNTNSDPDYVIYLESGTPNRWMVSISNGVSVGDSYPSTSIPTGLRGRAFTVDLPPAETVGTVDFLFVGQLPTNTINQTIKLGRSYNLITVGMPIRTGPNNMNFIANSVLTSLARPTRSDLMWVVDRDTQLLRTAPIYNASRSEDAWRFIGGGSVPNTFLGPDDAMIVYTRQSAAGEDKQLSVGPPYDPPTTTLPSRPPTDDEAGGGNESITVGNPTVESLPVGTNVTVSTATLSGQIVNTGNTNLVARGFFYATQPGVSPTDAYVGAQLGDGAYSVVVTGLTANTKYYFRAYATNAVGSAVGREQAFWTLAETPTAPTVTGAGSNALFLGLGSDGNPEYTEYQIKDALSGLYVQASQGELADTAVWRPRSGWGTQLLINNTSMTNSYSFVVKARNGENIETSFGPAAEYGQ
jgi:autotransporter-associated beta strand protein